MLFSVVTVVRNDCTGFLKTMDSVERQTFTEFEWIVVDGGSTDGTVDWIKSGRRVTSWTSENDSGIYDAMNKGITKSNGEYLVFLNAGDVFTQRRRLDAELDSKAGASTAPRGRGHRRHGAQLRALCVC